MRRKEDRTSQILELLVKEKKMEVAGLSAHLGVSQVTVRKDLDAMEAQGLIKREHGFAVLSSTDDIKGRLAYHYEEKRRIALRAAELVRDGDTIMIESGSCCALLAAALTESRSGVTIITNSAFIADYIRRSSDFQIILLGGIYQQDAQVMVGPMVRQCAENFWVDRFFIGVDGWSARAGFTHFHPSGPDARPGRPRYGPSGGPGHRPDRIRKVFQTRHCAPQPERPGEDRRHRSPYGSACYRRACGARHRGADGLTGPRPGRFHCLHLRFRLARHSGQYRGQCRASDGNVNVFPHF